MLHKHKIGVCVDEAVAYLLEEKNDEHLITIIKADELEDDADAIKPTKHQKDHAFYKRVFDMIQDFDKICLFGPEKARNEIIRRIRAKKLNHILVLGNSAEGKVTENQKIDFINGFFKAKS